MAVRKVSTKTAPGGTPFDEVRSERTIIVRYSPASDHLTLDLCGVNTMLAYQWLATIVEHLADFPPSVSVVCD